MIVLTSFLLGPPVCAAFQTAPNSSLQDTTDDTSEPREIGDVMVVRPKRYAPDTAATGTRTSTPIGDTPASVQVVTEEVMSDQGIWRLKDAVRNVSGVQSFKTEGFALTFESAFIRGFQQEPYLDGGRTWGLGPVDLAGLERVEVLKGPASLLYGAIEPGGVLNLVPKTPTFEERTNVTLQTGSYDFYRASFDVDTPLDEDGTMAVRIAGAVQDSHSFRDSIEDESIFVAPSFAWRPSEDTDVTAWIWYQNQDKPVDDGVAFSASGQPVADIDTFLGDPDHNSQSVDDFFTGLKLEHRIDDGLTFRQEFQGHLFDSEMDAVRRFGGTNVDGTVSPFYDGSHFNQWDLNGRSELVLETETGDVHHTVLGGLQFYRRGYTFKRRRDTTSVPNVSITDPNFPDLDYVINNTARSDQHLTFAGLYVQDQMRMADDRLHVLAGVRTDRIWQNNHPAEQDDSAQTWRLGALYDATETFSPYFNVSTSFDPNSPGALTFDGSTLDPETGIQYEVGAKMSFLEDRLQVTAALYEIDKEDVAVADPVNVGFQVNGGELRSRGFEFDVLGKLSDGLDVIASYAYTDTEVVESSALPEGSRFRGIPLHAGSLWLRYSGFERGSTFEGLQLGAGLFASSSKLGDNTGTFELPSFKRIDVSAGYDQHLANGGVAHYQLNVLNLLDEEYYESSFNIARVQPGSPLTILASVGLTL